VSVPGQDVPMPESHACRGARRGRRLLTDLGDEIRAARGGAGLTLAEVANAAGISAAELSRIERGLAPWLDVLAASRICAIVGLDVAVRAYPGGDPLRDRVHVPMFAAFRSVLGPGLRLRAEVPVSGSALRAWDGTVADAHDEAAVELESRVSDAQALVRRVTLKKRDSGIDRVILVVLDTRTNRLAMRAATPLLETEFPLQDRAIRRALAAGAVPSASGILLLGLRPAPAAHLAPRKQTTPSG
jgi:transcriptional regulator with XRE-family HTH domain